MVRAQSSCLPVCLHTEFGCTCRRVDLVSSSPLIMKQATVARKFRCTYRHVAQAASDRALAPLCGQPRGAFVRHNKLSDAFPIRSDPCPDQLSHLEVSAEERSRAHSYYSKRCPGFSARPLEKPAPYLQNVETHNRAGTKTKRKRICLCAITEIHDDSPLAAWLARRAGPEWATWELGWGRDMDADPVNTLGAKDLCIVVNAFTRPLPPA
jgi:hypothetical protein